VKWTITPGLRQQLKKIAKKGTGKKSAMAYHVEEGDSADDAL
jgi:hypothetical protein